MRLFQNSGIYHSYRPRLAKLTKDCESHREAISAFLADRYGIAHVLEPVLSGEPTAFFTNGDDEHAQRLWASEKGLKANSSLADVLLAQIEDHRAEVFYNSDPMRYGDEFLLRLPGCVRRTVAWRAAPSQGGRFLKHDVIVNNFPRLLEGYRAQGVRAEFLAPAHDPAMDEYAGRRDRPVDVLFIGSYSRHHTARAQVLERVAKLRNRMKVVMHLDRSRMTRLAETPLGWIGPLGRYRRNKEVRAVAATPVFGRDLLNAIANAKIVINGAIDMAGADRGNMRVWEALGCGAALVSDEGSYPDEMVAGQHFVTYKSPEQAAAVICELLSDDQRRWELASAGHAMIANHFSKSNQWARFVEIVE
jgi:glycosyltransferase involved in cell wall biosynthesis